MRLNQLLEIGINVQIVVNLADLKELFMEWMDEHQKAIKATSKKDAKVSAEEAKRQLGVTTTTLWRWAKEDYLTPVKVGKRVYYWQSDIDKLSKKET